MINIVQSFRIFVGSTLLATILSACGVVPAPSPVALKSPAHSIVVVSAIPKEISVGYEGAIAFGNESETINPGRWDLPDVAANAAKAALGDHFAVTTKSLATSPTDRNFNAVEFAGILKSQQATLGPADLYVVISPQYDTSQITQAAVGFHGFGISKRSNPFFTWPPIVHTFGIVALFDGADFKLIEQRNLQIDIEARAPLLEPQNHVGAEMISVGGVDRFVPVAPLSDAEWTGGWIKLTKDQKAEAQQKMTKLLDLSVRFTLEHLLETGKKP